VRVRYLSLDGSSVSALPLWRSVLDDQERRRADRFHFERDYEAFVAAHALTRATLSEMTGVPVTAWRFVQGPFGKPAIAPGLGSKQLRFNMSHTHGLVACAVTFGRKVGVDVETSDRTTELSIADRYFAPEEAAMVRVAPLDERRRLFFRFWTLKEAFIKATGEGLSRPLPSFGFMLDPIRITFHPNRDDVRRGDSPAHWQFEQCYPVPNQFLALALQRTDASNVPLDIRAMQVHEMTLR
jgi:4'-phosphopantetheinyl transferase